ncbi:MAG: sigma-70 family RNA polymerase sigma factor [Firmicutes bacterium]|nr:sigma-70 family RNA polymerase sigma factor [Bacillota bacterium]
MEQPLNFSAEQVIAGFEGRIREAVIRYRFVPGFELEDAVQEGRIAVWTAMKFYNGQIPFPVFAEICVRNRAMSYIKHLNRKKRFFSCRVSLDEPVAEDGTTVADLVPGNIAGPEGELLAKELYSELAKAAEEKLTPLGRQVFALLMEGYTYREIAEIINVNKKTADNALQRARRKLQEYCRKEWLFCGSA